MIRNDLQSRTIDALRLVLIFCVVLVHAYTATRADIDTGQYPIYRFVSFFFSLSIAQIAIPGFFFISGYLYFRTHRTYPQRIHHEWRRLMVPYLFWNGVILLMYWGLECIPSFRGFFSGENLPIHNYSVGNFIRAFWDCSDWDNGNGTPILHQFWYIRNLLILSILSPVISRYVRWTGAVGILPLIAWWIFDPGQAMIAKSIAFFAFGAWFSINNRDFLAPFRSHIIPITALSIVLLVITMYFWDYSWAGWINRLNAVLGLAIVTACTAKVLSLTKEVRSLIYLQGLTFFIYATHDPLIILIKRFMLRIVPTTDLWLTVIYFTSTIMVIFLCIAGYYLVKWIYPPLMSLMVGARSHKTLRV